MCTMIDTSHSTVSASTVFCFCTSINFTRIYPSFRRTGSKTRCLLNSDAIRISNTICVLRAKILARINFPSPRTELARASIKTISTAQPYRKSVGINELDAQEGEARRNSKEEFNAFDCIIRRANFDTNGRSTKLVDDSE